MATVATRNGNGHRKTREPIPLALLVEAISRKLEKGESLEPGEHVIKGTATIELDCVLSKAEGTSATPSYRPDAARLVTYALAALDVSLERTAEIIEAAARAELVKGPESARYDIVAAALARVGEAWKATQDKTPREGAVKVSGTVEIRSFDSGVCETPLASILRQSIAHTKRNGN